MNQTQGKGKEKELRRKKKAEKDKLISEVQILSPVRFNIPFNYLTVHLCKHPHPLLPEPETHTYTHIDTDRHVDSTVGGLMCKKLIKIEKCQNNRAS